MHEFDAGMEYQALPPGARITFNLQDADLPDLIRAIGNITGRRFILPGKVRSIKTTIYSPTKVTPAEAYQAFLSVLAVNGMTVVPSGRYLKIEETAGAATQVLPTYGSGQDAPTDDRFITRIVRLRSISADDASTVLGHFKSRDGDITPYAATNTLIITDLAANIRRMLQILGEVDVSGVGEQIWVEPVHYALASELATRLTEILGGATPGAAAARPGERRVGRSASGASWPTTAPTASSSWPPSGCTSACSSCSAASTSPSTARGRCACSASSTATPTRWPPCSTTSPTAAVRPARPARPRAAPTRSSRAPCASPPTSPPTRW